MRTEDVWEVGGGAGSIEQAEPKACVRRRAVLVVEISRFYELPAGAGKRDPPSTRFGVGHFKKKKSDSQSCPLSLRKKRLS